MGSVGIGSRTCHITQVTFELALSGFYVLWGIARLGLNFLLFVLLTLQMLAIGLQDGKTQ